MFSFIVLFAALGALSYEMIEDNLVNLIYARMFGWRMLLLAYAAASFIVLPVSAVFVVLAPLLFRSYFPLVQKAGAVILIAVGIGWLLFSVLKKEEEPEEVSEARELEKGGRRTLALATQLVAIEEVEIVAIMIPLGINGHPLEAISAGIVAVVVALFVALTFRQQFARIVRGRFRLLKGVSGIALVILGLILLFY
ncbi:hypothetical protein IX51_11100 [uncultured archaeon]|nr:hypothetical protein IX51_11100 [uncultured archaeon]